MKVNDILAVSIIFMIPILWVLQGLLKFNIPAEMNGVSGGAWMLVVQFYFRKAKDEK